MYAWRIATNISKPVKIINIPKGKIPIIPEAVTKTAKTFSTMWPAVMLAARRSAKLNGLERYVNSSITTISGARNAGVPFGRKSEK